MQNIKNIIFDYGNVIFRIDFDKVHKSLKELGIKDVDSFFGHLKQDPIFDLFDRGDVSSEDFRNHVRQVTDNKLLTDQQIDDAWNSILVGVEDGTHDVLIELKKHYRTFLLSNNNQIHYQWIKEYLKKNFGFENNEHLFEKTYYSHLVGMRKPESQIFKLVLQENNLTPNETLFIDDSPQHLEAASTLGIQTYLMKTPDTLQKFAAKELL